MISRTRGVVVRITTYSAGAMRKHGSFRHEHCDPMRVMLDSIPSRVAPCNALGYVIKKKGSQIL